MEMGSRLEKCKKKKKRKKRKEDTPSEKKQTKNSKNTNQPHDRKYRYVFGLNPTADVSDDDVPTT